MVDVKSVGEEYKSDGSPTYSIGSKRFILSIATALVLVTANIALIVYLSTTSVAGFTKWAFSSAPFSPFFGLVIFGVALTAGRYYGLKALHNDSMWKAASMVLVVQLTYGVFGAGVLSMYPQASIGPAIAVTFAIVAAYTAIVTGVVYSTGHSFSAWGMYGGGAMLIGIISVFAYTLLSWTALLWLGFAAIIIGFALDLVYEIWHTSNSDRGAIANGFAVYIAFMGIFVHVLQLVLEVMTADG